MKIEEERSSNVSLNDRREFLKKTGKAAVYVPPAIALIASPSFAKMRVSCGSSKGCKDFQRRLKDHDSDNNFTERLQNALSGLFRGFNIF